MVNGLWPQYERGYPQDCATGERDVPNNALRSLYDIMPSAGLIRHQWRKHGSCAGLSQSDYFKVVRKARNVIAVPGEFARLARETERLAKSCRELVWLNPLLRYEAFEPRALGIAAMLPHVHRFLPVHDLRSLEALARILTTEGMAPAPWK